MATVYPITYSCQSIDAYRYSINVPEIVKCNNTAPTLVRTSDELWCKTACEQDVNYNNPIPRNETFKLQLSIVDTYSADLTNPNLGWDDWLDIELCNAIDGSSVSTTRSDFSNCANNTYANGRNYQNIEIDTSKAIFAGLNVFNFKFTTTDGLELYSEPFELVDIDKLLGKIVSVESSYDILDVLEQSYGTPDATDGEVCLFSNKRWYWGNIQETQMSFKKTIFNDEREIETLDFVDTYRLQLSRRVPPYAAKMLMNALAGENVMVNGITYIAEELATENQIAYGNGKMFLFNVLLQQETEIDGKC